MGSWIIQHQAYVASIITLLVSSAWTPLIRKLPQTQWLWIIIRAVLAGVPRRHLVGKLGVQTGHGQQTDGCLVIWCVDDLL